MRKGLLLLVAAIGFALVGVNGARAATETVLYAFTNGSDGGEPIGGVIFDSDGNLYGTTAEGGVYDQGTVYELSFSNGGWTETVLYSFTGHTDGGAPAAGLLMDKAGNLYGTTEGGGSRGEGTVFELLRLRSGWYETVLHNFIAGSNDGFTPSGLIVDRGNHAFGTTLSGGAYSAGTVFGMQHTQTGWQEQVLYSFSNTGTDGYGPRSGVVVDNTDHLFGTTLYGGHGRGTVFELAYTPQGWKERIICYFEGGYDGANPSAALVLDGAGNLYGTTPTGGTNNAGTVFQLSQSAHGWTKTVIYDFSGDSPSNAALTFDRFGDLYGTTQNTIYELTPSGGGWTERLIASFVGSGGYGLDSGLTFDQAGNIYGTAASGGGVFNAGVVYEITP